MPEHTYDPVYQLCLAVVRQTIADALNGCGPGELAWLYSPPAQMSLQRALGLDEEGTLVATRRTVERLAQVVGTEAGDRLHQLIEDDFASNVSDLGQIRGVLRGKGQLIEKQDEFCHTEI